LKLHVGSSPLNKYGILSVDDIIWLGIITR